MEAEAEAWHTQWSGVHWRLSRALGLAPFCLRRYLTSDGSASSP